MLKPIKILCDEVGQQRWCPYATHKSLWHDKFIATHFLVDSFFACISSELFFKITFFVCLSKKDRRIMSYDYTVNNMKLVAFAISYWASIQNFLMFLASWSFFCQISGLFLLLLVLLVMKIDEMFVEQSVNEGLIGCVFKTWKEHAKKFYCLYFGSESGFFEKCKVLIVKEFVRSFFGDDSQEN